MFAAPVLDERCFRRSRWIFGIRSDISEASLIRNAPNLVKICSAEGVGKLIQRALQGLELVHVPVPPSALAAQADMHYFSIGMSGPCWQHILATKQVGVYLPGELGKAVFEVTIITEATA
jgi:type VI secretion system protein ImpJ